VAELERRRGESSECDVSRSAHTSTSLKTCGHSYTGVNALPPGAGDRRQLCVQAMTCSCSALYRALLNGLTHAFAAADPTVSLRLMGADRLWRMSLQQNVRAAWRTTRIDIRFVITRAPLSTSLVDFPADPARLFACRISYDSRGFPSLPALEKPVGHDPRCADTRRIEGCDGDITRGNEARNLIPQDFDYRPRPRARQR
jgi:hypothetical protein